MSPEPPAAAAEPVRRPPADEPEPSAQDSAPPSETGETPELRCTICGLRACWTG